MTRRVISMHSSQTRPEPTPATQHKKKRRRSHQVPPAASMILGEGVDLRTPEQDVLEPLKLNTLQSALTNSS
jgi:hypothetical protein